MRSLTIPATTLCLLAAILAAPSANAYFFAWGAEDHCDGEFLGSPKTWCSVDAALVGQVHNPWDPCTMAGTAFVACEFEVTCGTSFSNEVPVRFTAQCTGSAQESCDQLEAGDWDGCGAVEGTYAVTVAAGACATYTVQASVTPLILDLPSASVTRTVEMCVHATAGPTVV